tara:strand:+ start:166 stop:738 length:573 start_codon:yes stop_codon:yes gene_type:complete
MNFIEVYDNALTSTQCKDIINFIDSSALHKAELDGKVQPDIKDCWQSPADDTHLNQDNIAAKHLKEVLFDKTKDYIEKYPELNTSLDRWVLLSSYNLQKYNPKQGYPKVHCEQGTADFSLRMLVWMIYLNTVTDDGGTEFPQHNKITDAVEGRLVLWPAGWTHMHRGITSNTQTKYIATGWYEFVLSNLS